MITNNLAVISAICGNFWQESTVNPGIWEGLIIGNPGYGLGQWTDNSQVTRRTALFNYLNSKGLAYDDGIGQLEFLIYEDIWNIYGADQQYSIYQNLTEYLTSTDTNIGYLTQEFMYHWEGIYDGTESNRIISAYRFYNLFADYISRGDTYREPWFSGNYYLTENESNWNALRIMDYFLKGSPPIPPEPVEIDKKIISAFYLLRKKKKGRGFVIK